MEDKVVLITGASSGIGAGIARHFAAIGYKKLALVARRRDLLEGVAKECQEKGAERVLAIVKDLKSENGCEESVAETVSEFGRLDILLSNAGTGIRDSVREMTRDGFRGIMDLNLTAAFLMTKFALPHLEKTKGNILYISSSAGHMPCQSLSVYCASKAALNHFASCVALEEAPNGIRVNVLSPGVILTENQIKIKGQEINEEGAAAARAIWADYQPLGRCGELEDMSKMAAFLVSDNNTFMTGSNVVVDGGLSLSKLEL